MSRTESDASIAALPSAAPASSTDELAAEATSAAHETPSFGRHPGVSAAASASEREAGAAAASAAASGTASRRFWRMARASLQSWYEMATSSSCVAMIASSVRAPPGADASARPNLIETSAGARMVAARLVGAATTAAAAGAAAAAAAAAAAVSLLLAAALTVPAVSVCVEVEPAARAGLEPAPTSSCSWSTSTSSC